jgi:hypothetical protein
MEVASQNSTTWIKPKNTTGGEQNATTQDEEVLPSLLSC